MHNRTHKSYMNERIIRIEKSSRPEKKYMAFIKNKEGEIHVIHFGASDYPQYRDRTGLGLYTYKNHGDIKRMRRYFTRHSGTPIREKAIEKEKRKSRGIYNAKILSHMYLW